MPARSLEDRVTDLEILLTHQQRHLADLNEVLLEQQRAIEMLKRTIARLSERSPTEPSEPDAPSPESEGLASDLFADLE